MFKRIAMSLCYALIYFLFVAFVGTQTFDYPWLPTAVIGAVGAFGGMYVGRSRDEDWLKK